MPDKDKDATVQTQAMPREDCHKGSQRGIDAATAIGGTGESGGGAYPNPHTGQEGSSESGHGAKGGQTIIAYHGSGQLGRQKTKPGGNKNSGARGD